MKVGDLVRYRGAVGDAAGRGCFGIILRFGFKDTLSVPFVMWRLDNGRLNGQYVHSTEVLEVLNASR